MLSNRVTFERQRLGGLASRQHAKNRYLLFGLQYGSTEFKRFAVALTPQAADFGITDSTFPSGTVSEKIWDLSVVAGYELNTLFTRKETGWYYQIKLLAGTPLYSSMSSTDIDAGSAFSDSFNGISLRFNGVYGYQFGEDVIAAFAVEGAIAQHDAIDTDLVDAGGRIEISESRVGYIYPSLALLWSF